MIHDRKMYAVTLDTLRLMDITVAIVGSADPFKRAWKGGSPGCAQAAKIEKRDVIFVERTKPEYLFKKPLIKELLDIVHEASHLVLDNYLKDEDRGVAQGELIISKLINPRLFNSLRKFQDEYYEWGQRSYKEMRQTKRWAQGFRCAKARLLKRAHPHQLTEIQNIELEHI